MVEKKGKLWIKDKIKIIIKECTMNFMNFFSRIYKNKIPNYRHTKIKWSNIELKKQNEDDLTYQL